jgi:predicted transposase YdaD
MEGYKKSVAEYYDVQLMMECSLEEGREEGMQKGIQRGIQRGRQEGRLEGMQIGMLKGRQEGRIEGLLRVNEIARNLQKKNFSMTDIIKITGLTPEQIQQL